MSDHPASPGASAHPHRAVGRLRQTRRRGRLLLGGLGLLGLILAACTSAPAAPPPSAGTTLNLSVPSTVRHLTFVDQHGRQVSLGSWPGRTLLVVPFLSLCTDICPMTTGNLYRVEQALRADGQGGKVEIVEVSVDPGRDSPARLAAYATLTGAGWPLLTESPSTLAHVAKFFGWYYQVTAEQTPPSIDWWTHRPLTYDIDHSDGYDVISPSGVLRFSTNAAPNFRGTLNPALHRFLSPQGLQHLAHPAQPSYTPDDILGALGWVVGQNLPPVGG